MTQHYQQALNKLIAVTQQMIDALQHELELDNNENNQINETINETKDNSNPLTRLNEERDQLIKWVFNKEQSEHYVQHLPLINQVIALDKTLIQQAEKNKLALKTSLLNIKKSQKAKNSYAQY